MPRPQQSEPLSWSKTDHTDMKPGVGERKWEIDSLCYPMRLAHGYWQASRTTPPHSMRSGCARCGCNFAKPSRSSNAKNRAARTSFQRQAFSPYDTLVTIGLRQPGATHRTDLLRHVSSVRRCVHLSAEYVPANFFAVHITATQLRKWSAKCANDAKLAARAGSVGR